MDYSEDLVSAFQTVKATFDLLQIRYFIGGSYLESPAQELMVMDLLERLRNL